MTRIAIDPVTRIEGHLRIEVEVSNGVVTAASVAHGAASYARRRRADARAAVGAGAGGGGGGVAVATEPPATPTVEEQESQEGAER